MSKRSLDLVVDSPPNVITSPRKGRWLLGATWSAIENLGIMHVGKLTKLLGHEVFYCQPKNHDFTDFKEKVRKLKPVGVGYNCYSGAQVPLISDLFTWLKREHPEIRIVVGGPHPTYFPEDFVGYADNIVMSEGFNAMRRILNNEVGPGIIEFRDENMERMPLADREGYYRDSPFHRDSPIKSISGERGCPYNCEYCNNSTTGADVIVPFDLRPPEDRLILSVLKKDGHNAIWSRKGTRAFPRSVSPVEDVIAEAKEIQRLAPNTKMIYDQSDVWLQQSEPGGLHYKLAHRWKEEVGIPIHGQMRWEMLEHDAGSRRLDLAVMMGATGLTLAIESADPVIRKYVLDRKHPTELMYEGTKKIMERGLRLRSEQILGLLSGTTPLPSLMNLDLDLSTLELNIDLIRNYGIPNVAWASSLVLYAGVGIGVRGFEEGFTDKENRNPPDEFFDRLQHRFLKGWHGPEIGKLRVEKIELREDIKRMERRGEAVPSSITERYNQVIREYGVLCEKLRNNPDVWLSGAELGRYREQNAELRRHFNTFALIPQGHVLARSYLESQQPFSYDRLGRETEEHLRVLTNKGNQRAAEILRPIEEIRNAQLLDLDGSPEDEKIRDDLKKLAPYLAVLPKPDRAVQHVIMYTKDADFVKRAKSKGRNGDGIDPYTLTTAVRRHLYENVLYDINDSPKRVLLPERYPAKV